MFSQHGGDLDSLERNFKIKKENVKDFSGNINPFGAPKSVITAIKDNASQVRVYPDVKYLTLRKAISKYTSVSHENILVGNGTTELISNYIQTMNPKKALIIVPAYSEYERILKNIDSEIIIFPLLSEEDFKINYENLLLTIDSSVELVIICNPNNPTGTFIDNDNMINILNHCKKTNTFVMVDETYCEFVPDDLKVTSLPLVEIFDNLFVIRGASKFFAVPGLRIGYGLTSNMDFINSINNKKDPWSVNILSAIASAVMFNDLEYINKTKILIKEERQKMFDELNKIENFKIYESVSNFLLIRLKDKMLNSTIIFEKLVQEGLVIRDCRNYPYLGKEYLRVCILLPEDNERLIHSLKKLCKKNSG